MEDKKHLFVRCSAYPAITSLTDKTKNVTSELSLFAFF